MLSSLILKLFVPGSKNGLTPALRVRCGIVSGITGIVCNIVLVIIKLTLAAFTGSIAVAADAVNNLSDAGSGVITVAGFRLSSQPPDAEHPFGHGRTEYIAALIVALLIVGLGISFLKDSVVALFRPSPIAANNLTIIIFCATIIIKCWMFFFFRKVAKLINSEVIKAAAYDSLSDCLGTGVVAGSLICSRYTAFPVDGCAGIIVALMILWAGGNVLKETFSKLLGEPPDHELVSKLKATILATPGIDGVLLGNDWGSQRDMLMSPETWREMLAPGARREYDVIREAGLDIWIHSCGNIRQIIPDLIDMGAQVLNPIQPECMDIYELKDTFGDQMTFWGGISTQHTLPFGTPEEVEAEVRRVTAHMSQNGGYILAAGQGIQADVPFENLCTLIDIANEIT